MDDTMCDKIIQSFIEECLKDKNKQILNKELLDPIIAYVGKQLIPYIVFSVVIISIIISLMFSYAFIALIKNRKTINMDL
jgi:hypothetical protein